MDNSTAMTTPPEEVDALIQVRQRGFHTYRNFNSDCIV
jgi:hypothetical protein